MLNITFGRENYKGGNFERNCNYYFRFHHKPEWFQVPIIQRIIKEVDHSDVVLGEALVNQYGVGYSVETLCTGTKCLCCIYFCPEACFNISLMGDNCLPFLIEMAKEKDLMCVMEHFPCFDDDLFDEMIDKKLVIIDGQQLESYEQYCELYQSYSNRNYEYSNKLAEEIKRKWEERDRRLFKTHKEKWLELAREELRKNGEL